MTRLKFLAINFFWISAVWAYDKSDPNWKSVDEQFRRLCESVAQVPAADKDRPSVEQIKSLQDCDAENFYYGFSESADYSKARHCAYAGGHNAVLAMIYANGHGVARNLDRAIYFACEMGGAPMEIEGRLAHLQRMKEEKDPAPFDYCDDITSGGMMGICSAKEERFLEAKRTKAFSGLIAKWSDAEKAAFLKLQKSAEEFADARSRFEVDLSGSARSMFVTQERSLQDRDFLESLQKLESGKAPSYTAAQGKEEDAKLNELYKKVQSAKKDEDGDYGWGTVTPEDIKKTQRAWIKYRDAWVDFAKIKYTKYQPESIATWFTKKRNHMLRSFLN